MEEGLVAVVVVLQLLPPRPLLLLSLLVLGLQFSKIVLERGHLVVSPEPLGLRDEPAQVPDLG